MTSKGKHKGKKLVIVDLGASGASGGRKYKVSAWPLVVVDSKTVSPEGAAVKARVYKFDSRTTKALRADVKAID